MKVALEVGFELAKAPSWWLSRNLVQPSGLEYSNPIFNRRLLLRLI